MKKCFIMVFFLFSVSFADAKEIELSEDMTQSDFKAFVKEFGASLLFNPMAPAEPLGVVGFDVSLETVMTDISDDQDYWSKAMSDNDPYSYLPIPRLHVQKGLLFNLDVGAMYVAVPDSNIKLWGLEAKYAFLEGGVVTPALSMRASYSLLQGVDDVDMSTQSLDILVSKGFLMLTPYAGASLYRVSGSENSSSVNLDDVNDTNYRGLVGVQFSPFPLLIINGEMSLLGEVPQYGLKIGLRF